MARASDTAKIDKVNLKGEHELIANCIGIDGLMAKPAKKPARGLRRFSRKPRTRPNPGQGGGN
jgi:hypothetical protein